MRGAVSSDLPLMTKSWVQEMRHAPFSKHVPDDVYYPEQRRLVLALLQRAWNLVAYEPDNPDHIYGFVTFELAPARLHWLYVKGPYQRVGLGFELLRNAFGEELGRSRILCSHASNFARIHPSFLDRHKLVYSPYLIVRVAVPSALGAVAEPMAEFPPSSADDIPG